jgi:small ligand-binding sensory domain FIST
MPFASALSEHPDPAEAAGEVVGALLERLGPEPDLMVLFVTGVHTRSIADIASTVSAIARPRVLVGATAVSVLGGPKEVEEQPAIALWGARFSPRDDASTLRPVRLDAVRTSEGIIATGLDALPGDGVLLLLADPLSFPLDDVLHASAEQLPGLTIIGGVASAGFAPGANRLVLDGRLHDNGAVGVHIPRDVADVTAVVSQGCRPVGDPLTVTRVDGNAVYEIAGRPALEKLVELLTRLPEEDRRLAQSGLHLGRVIDEHKIEFERGDFLVRNLMGFDQDSGAILVNDVVPLGATIQFQVRDAVAADEDLRALLSGREADAALIFTCNGRGTRLFGEPDHDARLVTELTGSAATAGMFCAGEIGPIGGRNFLHGFTASVAIFTDPHRG